MTARKLQAVPNNVNEVPYQQASLDIWDKKYRLKAKDGTLLDASIDGSYERVARALSEVESGKEKQKEWNEKFLWALRHGAIPAGRIISNAGALDTSPPPPPLTAPCPAPCPTPWTAYCKKCMKPV